MASPPKERSQGHQFRILHRFLSVITNLVKKLVQRPSLFAERRLANYYAEFARYRYGHNSKSIRLNECIRLEAVEANKYIHDPAVGQGKPVAE